MEAAFTLGFMLGRTIGFMLGSMLGRMLGFMETEVGLMLGFSEHLRLCLLGPKWLRTDYWTLGLRAAPGSFKRTAGSF